ncbi:MAG: ABC transporter substrate-binding protein, partial [Gemmatimonadaceae bacterium]
MDSRALIARSFVVASIALALGACAESPAGDTVTLRLWAMGREGEVVSELMPAFEREHPGIRVEV